MLKKNYIPKLTKEELIKQLKICGKIVDRESAHCDADAFLLRYINDREISKIWNKVSRGFYYI